MKKLLALCLTTVLILTACGTKKEKSLYVQGLELISLMGEMTLNDSYFDMFSTVADVKAQVESIAQAVQDGSYQNPKTVYQITADLSGLTELLEKASDASMAFDNMSPELKTYIQSRLFSSCASILNSSAGMEAVAASSIYTCQKSFVCHEAVQNTAYLYIYEGTSPVLVTFLVGEDHAVSASGFYILMENAENIESLSSLFDFSGFHVEELKID